MNMGNVAGAGIAAHLHQHVVPRWGGDSNFMPIIAQTKVLPQLLAETRDILAAAWKEGETFARETPACAAQLIPLLLNAWIGITVPPRLGVAGARSRKRHCSSLLISHKEAGADSGVGSTGPAHAFSQGRG